MRFIYTSTSRLIRKQHLTHLIKLYLDTVVLEIEAGLKYLLSNNKREIYENVHSINRTSHFGNISNIPNFEDHSIDKSLELSINNFEHIYKVQAQTNNDFIKKFISSLKFDEFYMDFQKRSFYGFVTAVWLLPVITMDHNKKLFTEERLSTNHNFDEFSVQDQQKCNNMENKKIKYENVKLPSEDELREMLCNEEYHQKIEELFEEFSENGWLKHLQ